MVFFVWTRSLLAGPRTPSSVRRRQEDQAFRPDLSRLVARVLQVGLEYQRGDAIELERAANFLREPPIVVGAFDATSVRLDLDDEDRTRRDDDRIQLIDDARALDEPGVAVDGEALRQPFHEEPEGLPLRIVGGLADLDELGRHGYTSNIFAVGEPDRELVFYAKTAHLCPGGARRRSRTPAPARSASVL